MFRFGCLPFAHYFHLHLQDKRASAPFQNAKNTSTQPGCVCKNLVMKNRQRNPWLLIKSFPQFKSLFLFNCIRKMTVFISLHAIAVSSVFRSLHIQQYGKQQEIEHFTLNWFWWADEMRIISANDWIEQFQPYFKMHINVGWWCFAAGWFVDVNFGAQNVKMKTKKKPESWSQRSNILTNA